MDKKIIKNYDWAAIEAEYISGTEGLRALALRFGVSRAEMGKRCASGGWVQKRKEYRDTLIQNVCQNSLCTREEEIRSTMELADLIDATIREIVNDPDRIANLASTRHPGKELEAMSRAIASNEELRRMCRGIMSPRDAERIKLDREKFLHEINRDAKDENTTITVKLEGDIERWAQ